MTRLEQQKVITIKQRLHFYRTSEEPPKFFGLPKVHKKDMPLRPIVSCRGSIFYNIARFVADISPLAGKSPYHLKNSLHLKQQLENVKLEEDEILTSFDVTSLFTVTPIEQSLDIIKDLLEKDETLHERTNLAPDNIIELLGFCLKTTYFLYNGNFYQQNEGAAMGSPVLPIVANTLMEFLEQKAIS